MNRFRFTGRLTRGPIIGLLGVLLLGVGCARKAPEVRLQPIDSGCRSLEAEASALRRADSLLVYYGGSTYDNLLERHPGCALLHARIGDGHRVYRDPGDAQAAYEQALAIEPCNQVARLGLSLIRLPLSPGATGRLREIEAELEAGAICGGAGALASAEWRVRLLSGDVAGADASLDRLAAAGLYHPALLELGRNLLRELPPDGILVTGNDMETDLALLARGDLLSPGQPLVVDLHLLENPDYVTALLQGGFPLDMSEGEVSRLAPFWSSEAGRRISVREQVLWSLLKARGSRDVHLTVPAYLPNYLFVHFRTTLVGLTSRLDESRGGIDLDRLALALTNLELTAVGELSAAESRASLPAMDGWAYGAAQGYRLLDYYLYSGLHGSAAAFEAGRPDLGRSLAEFTHDRADEIGVSEDRQHALDELDDMAER